MEHRFIHEYGTVSLDIKVSEPHFEINTEMLATETESVNDPRSEFEDEVAYNSPSTSKIDPKSQFDQALKSSKDAKSNYDRMLRSQTMTDEAKSKFDSVVESQSKSSNKSSALSQGGSGMPQTSVTATVVGQILQQATKQHQTAATKIQVSTIC